MSEQALNDARLISRYASARGLMPADSPLPNAINQAEVRMADRPLTAAEEQELNNAINASARLIAPVAVEQLRVEQRRSGRLWPDSRGCRGRTDGLIDA